MLCLFHNNSGRRYPTREDTLVFVCVRACVRVNVTRSPFFFVRGRATRIADTAFRKGGYSYIWDRVVFIL